jgi:TetR/AcrR family transcriptional repressor of nem operon
LRGWNFTHLAQGYLGHLELMVGLLPDRDKRAARSRAILTFSALIGAMSLARAVSDEALSREILKTVADLLKHPA